jgi:hypothetical protein
VWLDGQQEVALSTDSAVFSLGWDGGCDSGCGCGCGGGGGCGDGSLSEACVFSMSRSDEAMMWVHTGIVSYPKENSREEIAIVRRLTV